MTGRSSRPRPFGRFAAAAVVLGSIVVSLGFAELVIRFQDRGTPTVHAGGNHPRFLVREDAATGYSLRPGFTGTMINPWGDFAVDVAIDSLGNRDGGGVPDSAAFVILGLGDSFTYGEGVPIDSTYLAVLERTLREEGSGSVRVVKAGVPGFSARQMALRFRVLAADVKPDVVLLGLVPSGGDRLDEPFAYCEGYLVRSSCRPSLQLAGGDLFATPYTNPIARAIDAHLQSTSHLCRRIASLRDVVSCGRMPAPDMETRERWMEEMIGIVRSMDEAARASGARLLLTLIDTPYEWETPVARAAHREGIPCVRTDRPLALARRDGTATAFAHDDHWTSAAHALVAQLVLDELRSSELLPRR